MNKDLNDLFSAGRINLIIIYGLFILGIVAYMLPIVACIMAYIHLNVKDNIQKTHYMFSFRSGLIFLAGLILEQIIGLAFVDFSHIVIALFAVLVAVRSIIALKILLEEKAHPNHLTWWIN